MAWQEIDNNEVASSIRSKINDMTQELYQYIDTLQDIGILELTDTETLALLGDSEQQLTYRGEVILSEAGVKELIDELPEIPLIDGGNF